MDEVGIAVQDGSEFHLLNRVLFGKELSSAGVWYAEDMENAAS